MSYIKNHQDSDRLIYQAVEDYLAAWTSDDNIQLPSLINNIITNLNLSEDAIVGVDPMIRRYLRTHPEWKVTVGAKGGAQRIAVWQKRQNEKAALKSAKKTISDQIEAKLSENAKKAAKVKVEETSMNSSINSNVDPDDFSSDILNQVFEDVE